MKDETKRKLRRDWDLIVLGVIWIAIVVIQAGWGSQ